MQKGLVRAALLLAIALPSLAQAQGTTVTDGGKRQSMTGVAQAYTTPDSNGAVVSLAKPLPTREMFPAYGLELIHPAVLSSAFLHIPTNQLPSGFVNIDSSTAVTITGYTGLGLMVFPTLDDSAWCATVALQVRFHYSAFVDSQSTFRFIRPNYAVNGTNTNYSGIRDSVGGFMDAFFNSETGNDKAAMPGEIVLLLTPTTYPRGLFVPLTIPEGMTSGGLIVSFRWRPLNTYTRSGTAYATANEPRNLVLRADLVGWRN